MRNVIIGHCQDGKLRDTAVAAHHTPSALINGTKIRVHVPAQPKSLQQAKGNIGLARACRR